MILLASFAVATADSRVQRVVKRYDHLRVIYVQTADGKRLPVITNLDKKGKPMGPRVAPAPDWTRVYTKERGSRRIPAGATMQQVPQNVQTNDRLQRTRPGIPLSPDRKPNRAINPFRTVNPFTDPTAIPSSQ